MRDIVPKQMIRLIRRGLVLLGTATAVGCSSGDGGTGPGTEEPGAVLVILPATGSIAQGGSSTVGVILTRRVAFTGTVSLTVTGAPTGVTALVSDVQTTGLVTTATVTISVGDATPRGSYGLVVHGTGTGGRDALATFVLVVTAPPAAPCVLDGGPCEQWASSAIASSEYSLSDWSASQATGAPDFSGCDASDVRAWASTEPNGVDWLELAYPESVHPIEIRVYEVYGVSAIVKVEVRDDAGFYHTVYTAEPESLTCPRELRIPVTDISAMVKVVRVSIDQRTLKDWNEIDAVLLIGIP
jgi:hypothetical protein